MEEAGVLTRGSMGAGGIIKVGSDREGYQVGYPTSASCRDGAPV